jgi:hypothetical protein
MFSLISSSVGEVTLVCAVAYIGILQLLATDWDYLFLRGERLFQIDHWANPFG